MDDTFGCTRPFRGLRPPGHAGPPCPGRVPYAGEHPQCPACGRVYLSVAECAAQGDHVIRGKMSLPPAPDEYQPEHEPDEGGPYGSPCCYRDSSARHVIAWELASPESFPSLPYVTGRSEIVPVGKRHYARADEIIEALEDAGYLITTDPGFEQVERTEDAPQGYWASGPPRGRV